MKNKGRSSWFEGGEREDASKFAHRFSFNLPRSQIDTPQLSDFSGLCTLMAVSSVEFVQRRRTLRGVASVFPFFKLCVSSRFRFSLCFLQNTTKWAQRGMKRYDNYLGQRSILQLSNVDFPIVQCRFLNSLCSPLTECRLQSLPSACRSLPPVLTAQVTARASFTGERLSTVVSQWPFSRCHTALSPRNDWYVGSSTIGSVSLSLSSLGVVYRARPEEMLRSEDSLFWVLGTILLYSRPEMLLYMFRGRCIALERYSYSTECLSTVLCFSGFRPYWLQKSFTSFAITHIDRY